MINDKEDYSDISEDKHENSEQSSPQQNPQTYKSTVSENDIIQSYNNESNNGLTTMNLTSPTAADHHPSRSDEDESIKRSRMDNDNHYYYYYDTFIDHLEPVDQVGSATFDTVNDIYDGRDDDIYGIRPDEVVSSNPAYSFLEPTDIIFYNECMIGDLNPIEVEISSTTTSTATAPLERSNSVLLDVNYEIPNKSSEGIIPNDIKDTESKDSALEILDLVPSLDEAVITAPSVESYIVAGISYDEYGGDGIETIPSVDVPDEESMVLSMTALTWVVTDGSGLKDDVTMSVEEIDGGREKWFSESHDDKSPVELQDIVDPILPNILFTGDDTQKIDTVIGGTINLGIDNESDHCINPTIDNLTYFDQDEDRLTPMLHIPLCDLKLLDRNNPIFTSYMAMGKQYFSLGSQSWEEASDSQDVIDIEPGALDNMDSEALEEYLDYEEHPTSVVPETLVIVGSEEEEGGAEAGELDYDNVAEIVLIQTSLGMARGQFFDSIRLRHYFDAKQISYYLIDLNKDWSLGHGLLDGNLIEAWSETNLIYLDPYDESKIMTPQVLIDGVAIGGYQEVQDMEEDDDLDWALYRRQCPACFHPRSIKEESCESCGSIYQTLISPAAEREGRVLLINCGIVINNAEVASQKNESHVSCNNERVDLDFD